MKQWSAFLLFLMSDVVSATAGPVGITSGEHPDFTRLVMQYDGPVDWQLGRTLDGYSLRVKQQNTTYDMGKAFDLIRKNRLAAIWADSATGDLHFSIVCLCYAMPFEFRPGIIVVDLHDGPPPKGSSFELPLDGPMPVMALPEHELPKPQPPQPAYSWTDFAPSRVGPEATVQVQTWPYPQGKEMLTVDLGLEPLRLSLMEELSRGASQGIVDMAKPTKTAEQPTEEVAGNPSVQIHVGALPELVIRQKGEAGSPLTAQGAGCLTDAQLDIPVWGTSLAVSDQIGLARQGVTGEFDKPDPDALTRAIRFQLFLGFGAEARSLMRAFPADLPDSAIWKSMAHILDEEPDPAPAFFGMEECDTSAALWATLADQKVHPESEEAKAAAMRSFSALPPHLRRLLGPQLVENFLATEDIKVAVALREAILRAPGDPGPGIILMQAKMDHVLGKPAKAEAQLETLATASGPASAEALVALVEQKAALGQSVEFTQVQALEALQTERRGGTDAPQFQRALILARGASGDFDGAFAEIQAAPDATATLWHLLAQAGPDTAFLNHATLGESDLPPLAAQDSAALIASRMLGLGLADQAGKWLKLADVAPAPLRARIKLAQGDPQGTLDLLVDDSSSIALDIKAQAHQLLGQTKEAAALYIQLGKPEDEWSALTQTGDIDALAIEGPLLWKNVANIVTAAPGTTTGGQATDGPLARNKALVQDSASTRDAITALLESVKMPISSIQ